MRIIMTPFGSGGDVYPYVRVGLALQRRGHDVSMIINPYFEPLLDRAGLPSVPIGTADDYHEAIANPDMWHDRRGFHVLGDAVARWGREAFDLIQARAEAGADAPVLVAPGLAFSARVAHEALGLPLVTMHLQPSCLISAHEAPVLHPRLRSINRWPSPFRRLALALGGRLTDRALAPAANKLRAELGLPPVRRIVTDWWHSPQRVIGLFPDWYAQAQPDWPRQTVLTGFPLYDAADAAPLDPTLDDWLSACEAAGRRPAVFVAGTGNRQASRFFQAGADACRRLDRPGLLLTGFPDQLPDPLPDGVRHADYAPLSQVLPRAAAIAHHGGIGTAAEALRAGCPQLVAPMTFDQPDNAVRLERLGVARTLWPGTVDSRRTARALDALLGSDDTVRACRAVAGRFDGADPVTQTCELIEAAGP